MKEKDILKRLVKNDILLEFKDLIEWIYAPNDEFLAKFSFIKECMALNPDIMCLNYLDYQKDVADIVCS